MDNTFTNYQTNDDHLVKIFHKNNNAKRNINEENLNIKTILADGLPYLDSEIDIVSILGMGGRLIRDILNRADLQHVKRLVLSPNSEAIILREYLEKNNFKILYRRRF